MGCELWSHMQLISQGGPELQESRTNNPGDHGVQVPWVQGEGVLLKSPARATQHDGCDQDGSSDGADDDVGATGT